jgi:hypothetical protein
MEISWNLAVETTFVAGALNSVWPHNASVSPFYERITFMVRLPRGMYKPSMEGYCQRQVAIAARPAMPLRISAQIVARQIICIALQMCGVLAIRERAGH